GHRPGAGLLRADIAAVEQAAAALPVDQRGRLLRVLLLLQIHDCHVRALAGESQRDGPADAGVSPGDERRTALQPAAAAQGGILEAWARLHLPLPSRLAVLGLLRPLRLIAFLVLGFVRHAMPFADGGPCAREAWPCRLRGHGAQL